MVILKGDPGKAKRKLVVRILKFSPYLNAQTLGAGRVFTLSNA